MKTERIFLKSIIPIEGTMRTMRMRQCVVGAVRRSTPER